MSAAEQQPDPLVVACEQRTARVLGGAGAVVDVGGAPVVATTTPDGRPVRVGLDPFDVPDAPTGSLVIGGADVACGVGDLLAARAVDLLGAPPRAVHVAVAAPGRGGAFGMLTGAQRRRAVATLARPVRVRVAGEWDELLVGEGRRLAWFPRPLGAQHAVAVDLLATRLAVARHPDLAAASSHVAMRAVRAELVQFLAARSTGGTVPAWIARRLGGPGGRGPAQRRWSVVAEAHRHDGHVERCWAHGHDPVGTSAQLAALVARVVHEVAVVLPQRPLGPADVLDPLDALDLLAHDTGLSWGRVAPWSGRGVPVGQ